MRKIIVVFLALHLCNGMLHSQVFVQTTLPTIGLVQKSQLWNLVLINSGTAMDGRLNLLLRDRQTGIELLTATTNRFSLPKGSLTINVNTLNPIQYTFLGMEPGNGFNDLLPTGSYVACYAFTRMSGIKEDQIAEECVPFDIEPLSPPMLIFPVDSSLLSVSPSQFNWTPPMPTSMLHRPTYEILITEVKEGQKPVEALQDNPPFYSGTDISVTSLNYSAALPAFEKDTWYAWQVIARDDKNYAGKTDAWVFKIPTSSHEPSIIEMTPFVKLKKDNPDQSIAPDGILKIAYYNETGEKSVKIDVEMLSVASKNGWSFEVPLKPGENYIQYDLKKLMGKPDEGKVFKATLRNGRGESWMIRFIVRYFETK